LPARAAAALRLRRWTATKWLPELRPGTDSLFGGAAASTTTTRRLMSQGYGPQGNDWQQWGQSDPNQQPQGGQRDQGQPRGQPSPAPASDPWGQQSAQPAFGSPGEAGYPGAVGATPQFIPGDGVNWPRVRMLGMSLLIGVALLLLIRLGYSLASFLMADMLATGG